MVSITLTGNQLKEMINQLKPEEKYQVILSLAETDSPSEDDHFRYFENQMKQICQARNLNWDSLSKDERENLVDAIIHESRACPN